VKNDPLNRALNFNIDEEEEWCFYLIYKEREGITNEHF